MGVDKRGPRSPQAACNTAHEKKTILFISVPMLGDVLLTTLLMRSVKEKLPVGAIDVISPPGGAILLDRNADVREAMEPWKRSVSTFLAFVLRCSRRYDLVLSNSASYRALDYAQVMTERRISILPGSRGDATLKRRLHDRIGGIDYAH